MEYGSAFKKLREQQGISAHDVAVGIISSSTLFRFENDKSMLSTVIFNQLLNRIKVTPAEFALFRSENHPFSLRLFDAKTAQQLASRKFTELRDDSLKFQALSIESTDLFNFAAVYCRALLQLHQLKYTRAVELNILQNYFDQLPSWTQTDVNLFMSVFSLFDPIDVHEKSPQLLAFCVEQSQREVYFSILDALFANEINHDESELAEVTLETTARALVDCELLAPHINNHLNQGILNLLNGDKPAAEDEFSTAKAFCFVMNQDKLAEQIKRRANIWLRNSQDGDFHEPLKPVARF